MVEKYEEKPAGAVAVVEAEHEREEKDMYDATEHLETTYEGDHGIRRDLVSRSASESSQLDGRLAQCRCPATADTSRHA